MTDARRKTVRQRSAGARKKWRPEVLYSYSFPVASAASAVRRGPSLVEANESNLAELKATYPNEFTQRKYDILSARLQSPHEVCWLIKTAKGRWAGYCHAAFDDTINARINHLVRVGPEQVYFFDDYVFKRRRGRGLHAFSIGARINLLREQGITEVLITISKNNHPSIASFRKFGLRREARLVFIPALKRTLRFAAR
jgi:GNAT superfamily N-acetyltransferase